MEPSPHNLDDAKATPAEARRTPARPAETGAAGGAAGEAVPTLCCSRLKSGFSRNPAGAQPSVGFQSSSAAVSALDAASASVCRAGASEEGAGRATRPGGGRRGAQVMKGE